MLESHICIFCIFKKPIRTKNYFEWSFEVHVVAELVSTQWHSRGEESWESRESDGDMAGPHQAPESSKIHLIQSVGLDTK